MKNTRTYVGSVCVGAAVVAAAVYTVAPTVVPAEVRALVMLAALASVAEMLTFALPRAASGSIAFIPYLAAVVVAPAWPTVLAATLVKLVAELISRRELQKQAFNVAQLAVTLGIAVLTFRALGGRGMLGDGISSLSGTTAAAGIPAVAAFLAAFAVNTSLVQGVVARATGVRFTQALRENVLAGLAADVLASPIVFVFAWVYAEHGPIAAFGVWAPIVGFRQLTKTTLELEQTNQELLELMVKSIEARDAYTSGHSRRVRDYAEVIARSTGLSQREIVHVSKAALLHDVGKIHEKYAPILAKSDKLTPEEWNLMQQHPNDGADLVGTMTRLRELLPAIRHHHEQWDGSGYPEALSGEAIPLAARIIALADTVDAMTSERPYRRAMAGEEVRQELLRCRGRQFDPKLVDRILIPANWQKIFPPTREASFRQLAIVPRSDAVIGS